jgi:hypothetical protein
MKGLDDRTVDFEVVPEDTVETLKILVASLYGM